MPDSCERAAPGGIAKAELIQALRSFLGQTNRIRETVIPRRFLDRLRPNGNVPPADHRCGLSLREALGLPRGAGCLRLHGKRAREAHPIPGGLHKPAEGHEHRPSRAAEPGRITLHFGCRPL
ncbi:MAG TPA: hypothetical protein VMT15_12405 [Bryobacteraceae bacterium]|nr:hypothetical protein [Bryobacteraceae bacterium]